MNLASLYRRLSEYQNYKYEVEGLIASLKNAVNPLSHAKDVLNNNSNVIDVLMLSGIFESKSETKRLIEQNGVSINGEKVKSIDMIVTEDMLEDNALLIQKGKKRFIKMLFV